MRATAVVALAVCLTLAAASPAVAQAPSFELPLFGETTFSLTNTSILRYRGNDYELGDPYDEDFGSLYQRFDLALQGDELRVESRIDAFVPTTVFQESPCTVAGDSRCYLAWDLRPERLTLRWEPRDWTIEAGDTQLVFGRGIALSFRKVDLLGVDTALRGGHVRYQGENFRFGIHGGVANPQNQDPLDLSIIREFTDVVTGANAAVTIPGALPITVGAHAVRVWFEDEEFSAFTNRAVDVAGWSVEAPALADGQLALYAEANGMRRTQNLFEEESVRGGRAVYGSAQLQLSELTLLVEWKDYADFLVAPSTLESRTWRIYNAAPPVEFDGPQRLRAIGNQRGGGVRMDYAFLPGPWSFSVNSVAYGFNEEVRGDAWDGVFVTHSWVGLKKRQEYGEGLQYSLDFILGSRFEVLLHDIPLTEFQAGDMDRWMIHGRGELTLADGDHSVDIVVDHRHERELLGNSVHEFQIGGVSATYSFGVPFTVTLSLRWTDFQAGVVQRRQMVDYNLLGGEFYPALEGRYTFEPGTYLGLFVGQTPGGQICSGGVCRDVPTFEGIRLEFVGRI